MWKPGLLVLAAALALSGCATLPTGPNVMVLPGNGKDFDDFKFDDAVCRQWAEQQSGITKSQTPTDTTVTGAAVGTVLGAAGGAAIGAAAGNPALGAAVGAGVGLLGGTAVGADQASGAQWSLQRRYDTAYMQCMYAKGNQIPIPGGYQLPQTSKWQGNAPPPRPPDVPPPPPGSPPPPPAGPVR
jgi:OmpA family protein